MRGFLEIVIAALDAETALGGDAFDHADGVDFIDLGAIARRQQGRIALEQLLGQEHGHFFFDQRVRADGVAGRQHQAIAGDGDLRPQHAGRVDEDGVLVQIQFLLHFGHGRLVAHLGHALFQQRIHQGRLAHVGDAHDHDAQRFRWHAAVRRQRFGQVRDARHVARLLGRHRVRGHAFLGIEIGDPGGRGGRIGQVGLVEDLQARALAEQAQLVHHGIATGCRQARVHHFNHQVGVFHGLGRFLAGRVHVSWVPLYRHALAFSSFSQSAILRGCRHDVAFSAASASRATRTRQLVIIWQLLE